MPCLHSSDRSRGNRLYVMPFCLVIAGLASACGAETGSGGNAQIDEESAAISVDPFGAAWVDFDGDGKADYCRRTGTQNNVSSYLSCTVSTGTGLGTTYTSGVL